MKKTASKISLWLVYLSIFVFSVGFYLRVISHEVLIWYSILSSITFVFYAWDKFQSQRQGWRISEKQLHLLSLLGGWLGATIAQQWLGHKTSKRSFRRIYWMTLLTNMIIFAWLYQLHSEKGKSFLALLSF